MWFVSGAVGQPLGRLALDEQVEVDDALQLPRGQGQTSQVVSHQHLQVLCVRQLLHIQLCEPDDAQASSLILL